jgi:hypothetical protein
MVQAGWKEGAGSAGQAQYASPRGVISAPCKSLAACGSQADFGPLWRITDNFESGCNVSQVLLAAIIQANT